VAAADCGDPFEDLSDEETEELAELLARDGADSADALDDFSGAEKQRLADFLKDTGKDGEDLLAQMNAGDIKALLSFNRGRAGDMRKQLVRLHSRGEISGGQVSEFSRDLKKLESVNGLEAGPIKDIATAGDPGNVKGAMYEVRTAVRYGGNDVDEMSISYGPKGVDGEINIKLENGDFIEAKNKELTYNEFTDMKGKIDALEKHEQLDGHTITIVGREPPRPDTSLYQKFTDDLETYAQQKHGTDIEVKIKEEGDY
jgi:hypothetical protein